MAITSESRERAPLSGVEADRPEVSYIMLIGAALITVSAILAAVAVAMT
jgi:hypothetical protein